VKEGTVQDTTALWLRLIGLALIPLSVQVFIPAIGGALGVLTPLPLAYGMARRGVFEGLLSVAFVALLTSIFMEGGSGIYFLLETAPLSLGIRHVVRSKAPLYLSVLKAMALVAVTVAVAVTIYSAATGMNINEIYTETVQDMGIVFDSVSENNEMDQADKAKFQWVVEIWKHVFIGVWLSTLIMLVLLYSLMTRMWLIRAELFDPADMPLLSNWALPFPFVGMFVVLGLIVVISEGLTRDVALNALIPLGTLYGIQGMLVSSHLMNRWSIPLFFRVLILTFGALRYPFGILVAIALVGLFDTWFDLRRRFPLIVDETPSV